MAGEEGCRVAVGVEADAWTADVIQHQRIGTLSQQFVAAVLQVVFGFRRETDDERASGSSSGDLREDIGGWLQLQLDGFAPLDLLGRRVLGR